MPTHDYVIANGTGAAVRADINLALSAIVSLNSSASEPATMYAYQLWADTALGLLKIRNSANSAWITLRQLDGDFSIVAVEDGLQATPSLTFTNDLNTGVFRSGADALAIVTGGQYAITCTSTQAVGIKTANPQKALHVAGPTRVGADDATDAFLEIGEGATGNRTSYIDIVGDTTYTDYGLRVIRNNTGANATSELKHRGTGALNITTQEAAAIVFNTTNSPSMTITSGGLVGIGTSNVGALLHASTAGGPAGLTEIARIENTSIDSGTSFTFYGKQGSDASTKLSGIIGFRQTQNTDSNGRPAFVVHTGNNGSVTEKLRVTYDGDVSIVTGNLIIGTAGKGIDFSADGNAAGMTSELLDDYEEGTWTPVIVGTTTAGTGTYSEQSGAYTKVGRQVSFTMRITYSAHTGTGDIQLDGLPFTASSLAACAQGRVENFTVTLTNSLYVFVSGAVIAFRQAPTSGGAVATVPIDTAADLVFAGTYFI